MNTSEMNQAPSLKLNPPCPECMTSHAPPMQNTALQEELILCFFGRTEEGEAVEDGNQSQPERRMETRQPRGPLQAWWWWDAMGPDPAEAPACVLAD